MRLQHNISPPAPGRGGSRKRKRGADDQTQGTATPVASVVDSPSGAVSNASAFIQFKVDAHTPSELGGENANDPSQDYFSVKGSTKSTAANGRPKRTLKPSPLQPQHTPPMEDHAGEEEEGYASSSSDVLPPDLQALMDETTGLIMGKTPTKVMYLILKAKHRYAMEQNAALADEFKRVRRQLEKEKEEKEVTLDLVFNRSFE